MVPLNEEKEISLITQRSAFAEFPPTKNKAIRAREYKIVLNSFMIY